MASGVRSIKEECLSRVVPLGEAHVRQLVHEFVEQYHHEINYQGRDNRLRRCCMKPLAGEVVWPALLLTALSHLATRADKPSMQTTRSIYRGFCFPPEVIAHAVFLYHRFPLSLRDVEDLLAQRGIAVSYETIRRWCRRFGPHYARNVRRQQPTAGDHWLLDEVFLQIQGRRQYLWRAIDQDGDILDILMQRRRNGRAATRFVRKLLKQQQRSPNRLVTDKLGSYRVAHRAEIASVPHDTTQYANNRIEASHRRTRVRERQMLRFRSAGNAQRFLSVQASILNLFNWGRHQLRAKQYRCFRARAFDAWSLAIHG